MNEMPCPNCNSPYLLFKFAILTKASEETPWSMLFHARLIALTPH